ncbi:MAG TPA: indole-3-glycerol phosphate synthase TrpC [bacterium]|nr:indole-3-glycerol phosphate synthase TrpC [bacterium]HPN42394.1 indole-3-glycerol phosphate synthase TrpC [bacterium]
MDILHKIIADTRETLAQRKAGLSPAAVREKAETVSKNKQPQRFNRALQSDHIAIIAEVKKASPSKGVICPNFDHLQIAYDYTRGGAAAISVLTEEKYFDGKLSYLADIAKTASPPLLRKDFIIDSYQVYEAAACSASAILLIAAALDTIQIKEFLDLAYTLKLDAMVEVHNAAELEKALNANAAIIGVNNRNLATFHTSLNTSLELAKLIPADKIKVSESGIHSRADVLTLTKAGYNAVLVGELLMQQADRTAGLRALRGV